MKNKLPVLLLIIIISPLSIMAQYDNDSCHKSLYICSEPFSFPVVTVGSPQQSGPNYDCLQSYFPMYGVKWFVFRIAQSGYVQLRFTAIQPCTPEMIAFIIWGPYNDISGVCPYGLTEDKVVDCKLFQLYPVITATFYGNQGQYYYLHIITTQSCYPPVPYPVTINQSNLNLPGHGTLDCTPLNSQPCIFTFIYPDTTPCNTAANTFSITGQIGYMYPPADGYLIVKDLTSGLADTLTPPFQALSAFAIEGVPCDGQVHTIEAWFTDGECTISGSITAPSGECAVGVMSGGGHICQPSGPPVEVYITAYGGLPPYSFSWSLNGVPQPGVTGYNGPWPYVISATEAGTYALLSMSGSDCPGTATGSAVVSTSEPIVTLNDTTVCAGETVLLDAGAGFASYLWNTGFTGQILTVTQPGTYSVTVTDSFGCQASDSATITHHPLPQPLLIKHN
jgi:hypothetical protein